jgi:hypothetical protein
LAASELYAQLVDTARQQGARVMSYVVEPASWWRNGLGGYLKPDAYAVLALGNVREHWWIEVDLATESLPTIGRKLQAYLDFVARGQLGPGDLVPRVLVTAITRARASAVQTVMARLPAPAPALFVVASEHTAASYLLHSLRE